MSQETKERKQLDPAKTRESIMRAAFKVFAEKGYKGASIADIAKAAHSRKSLIQYHFGTKEQLWNACLSNKVQPVITAMDRLLESGELDFGEIVLTRYKLIRENPDVRRLIAWASLSGIPAPQFLLERRERILERLQSKAGHSAERLSRILFVLAASDGWLHFRDLYRVVAGDAVTSDEVERLFQQNLMEVASKVG